MFMCVQALPVALTGNCLTFQGVLGVKKKMLVLKHLHLVQWWLAIGLSQLHVSRVKCRGQLCGSHG